MVALDVHAQLLQHRLELARTPGTTVHLDHVPPGLLLQLVAISDAAQDCIQRILLCIDPRLPRDARTMACLMRDHITDAYDSPSRG